MSSNLVIEEGALVAPSEFRNLKISSLKISMKSRNAFLYGRRYAVDDNPKWRIIFLHDIGEHSNRYEDSLSQLVTHLKYKKAPSFEIVAYDYKGHGKSSGTRGHLDSIDDLCLDTMTFLNEPEKSELPTLVMGIGLGGIVALKIYHHYFSQLTSKISGFILINPALKLNWSIPSGLEGIARRGSLIFSKVKLPFQLEGHLFSGDSLVAEEFDSDPLVNHSVTLASLFEIQHVATIMRTSAYYLNIPVYMALSGKGKLYDNEITELFARGIFDCEVGHFPDADHDLLHHFDCEKLINSVYNWLNKQSFFLKG